MVKRENTGKEITQVPEEKQIPKEEQIPREKQVPQGEQIQEEKQKHITEKTSIGAPPATDTDSNKSLTADFPIVGIGASAGGLAAFEAFFSAISDNIDPGMAFVVIQHLDPIHKSMLTDLIGRYTWMSVYEVKDGMVVQPNCVYVIPPNCDMILEYSTLQYTEISRIAWSSPAD